ncbi:MAG: beta-lactamase class [Verrucomicrobiota bacterium]|jgi:beta-lactamase class A
MNNKCEVVVKSRGETLSQNGDSHLPGSGSILNRPIIPESVRFFFVLLVSLLVASQPASSAEGNRDRNELFARLEARAANGRIGVSAIDLSTNRRVDYRPGERFTMCSTFKVLAVSAVLKRVDENKEKLDRFVPYGEAQLLEYAPVTRTHVKEGGMTLEALCAAAIEQSDNTAANLVLEAIGGPEKWTEFARSLGDRFSRLDHNEPDLNIARPGKEDDTTTPAAMAADLQRLLASDFLAIASRTRLETWMQQNQTGLKMIRASIPPDWKAGDKTGRSGDGATNDIAVLRPPAGGPIFIAIYTVDPAESQEARDQLVADAAKAAIELLKK